MIDTCWCRAVVDATVSGALQCPRNGTVPLPATATGTFPLVVGPTSECP
ncbi:MAG: hypothetical protein AB1730_16280 [Myxococcota bacterium]